MNLEEITIGASIEGVDDRGPIKVKILEWFGEQALKIIFDGHEGGVRERILYRDDENGLRISDKGQRWSLDADGEKLRLVTEANRKTRSLQWGSIALPFSFEK